MKASALALLVVMVLSIIAPTTTVHMICPKGGKTCMRALNVCDTHAPAVSTNGKMPFISERSLYHPPATLTLYRVLHSPGMPDLLAAPPNEHPPHV